MEEEEADIAAEANLSEETVDQETWWRKVDASTVRREVTLKEIVLSWTEVVQEVDLLLTETTSTEGIKREAIHHQGQEVLLPEIADKRELADLDQVVAAERAT